MKVLTVFYTLIFLLLVPLTVFSDLESSGPPTCESSFNGNLFEGSSKSKIIEKYKWIDLDSMSPKLKKTDVKPASIFGKVTTSQSTRGTGVIGVKTVGNVTGPTNFAMEIGPEFKINSITWFDYIWGDGDAWSDTTKKSATSKKNTQVKGTYTLNGSGEVIAVSGGGGITAFGHGFRTSGTVEFHFFPTAEAKTLEVKVEQDKPKVYTCGHPDCDVELPSSDHHLITCGKEFTNHHGGVGTCKAKYYVCQSNCLLHPDTDDDGDSSASLSPSNGSYTASAGDTHTASVSVPSGFSSVYWYVASPSDTGLGTNVETDTGTGSTTSATLSYTFSSSASGDYVITAYTYLSDNSVVEPSYTVTVSGGSSTDTTDTTTSTDNTEDCSSCTDGCSACPSDDDSDDSGGSTLVTCEDCGVGYDPNDDMYTHITFTCYYCGESYKPCAGTTCSGWDSPDGEHAPGG